MRCDTSFLQLLVKDGHTSVLGGLVDRTRAKIRSGIPILSAIPLVGGLFVDR